MLFSFCSIHCGPSLVFPCPAFLSGYASVPTEFFSLWFFSVPLSVLLVLFYGDGGVPRPVFFTPAQCSERYVAAVSLPAICSAPFPSFPFAASRLGRFSFVEKNAFLGFDPRRTVCRAFISLVCVSCDSPSESSNDVLTGETITPLWFLLVDRPSYFPFSSPTAILVFRVMAPPSDSLLQDTLLRFIRRFPPFILSVVVGELRPNPIQPFPTFSLGIPPPLSHNSPYVVLPKGLHTLILFPDFFAPFKFLVFHQVTLCLAPLRIRFFPFIYFLRTPLPPPTA